MQGIECMTDAESIERIGRDRESHQRDLFESIEAGNFPKWRFCIQVMTDAQAEAFRWNPFDLTKVWPHKDYPLIEVGILELNRNPENYFAEVEQSSFSPSALVSGISVSPDKMLQARLMSYADAHRYRVGNNYQQLPVNRPRCPVNNYQRDGEMSQAQGGANAVYYPNTRPGTPQPDPTFAEPAWHLGDVSVDRYNSREGHDDFTQAGDLYRLFDEGEKDRLCATIAGGLSQARDEVQARHVSHCHRADEDYGRRLAQALGVDLNELLAAANAMDVVAG
jgi:catalase